MGQHKESLQLKKGTGLSTYPHSLEAEPFDISAYVSRGQGVRQQLCEHVPAVLSLWPPRSRPRYPALAAEVPCVHVDSRLIFLNTVTRLLLSRAGPRSLWESMQSRFMVRLIAFIGVKAAHLLEFALVVLAKSSVT